MRFWFLMKLRTDPERKERCSGWKEDERAQHV